MHMHTQTHPENHRHPHIHLNIYTWIHCRHTHTHTDTHRHIELRETICSHTNTIVHIDIHKHTYTQSHRLFCIACVFLWPGRREFECTTSEVSHALEVCVQNAQLWRTTHHLLDGGGNSMPISSRDCSVQ